MQNDNSYNCDTSVMWSGWYHLFINDVSAHIPDTCVATYSCNTNIPLWIRGGHPRIEDGVVTRDVCGHWNNYCCYYGSNTIKVKACPGNYYVYELVSPNVCNSAYCAGNYIYMSSLYTFMIFVSLFIYHYSSKLSDVRSISTSSTAVTPANNSPGNGTHCLYKLIFPVGTNWAVTYSGCLFMPLQMLKRHPLTRQNASFYDGFFYVFCTSDIDVHRTSVQFKRFSVEIFQHNLKGSYNAHFPQVDIIL